MSAAYCAGFLIISLAQQAKLSPQQMTCHKHQHVRLSDDSKIMRSCALPEDPTATLPPACICISTMSLNTDSLAGAMLQHPLHQ